MAQYLKINLYICEDSWDLEWSIGIYRDLLGFINIYKILSRFIRKCTRFIVICPSVILFFCAVRTGHRNSTWQGDVTRFQFPTFPLSLSWFILFQCPMTVSNNENHGWHRQYFCCPVLDWSLSIPSFFLSLISMGMSNYGEPNCHPAVHNCMRDSFNQKL